MAQKTRPNTSPRQLRLTSDTWDRLQAFGAGRSKEDTIAALLDISDRGDVLEALSDGERGWLAAVAQDSGRSLREVAGQILAECVRGRLRGVSGLGA